VQCTFFIVLQKQRPVSRRYSGRHILWLDAVLSFLLLLSHVVGILVVWTRVVLEVEVLPRLLPCGVGSELYRAAIKTPATQEYENRYYARVSKLLLNQTVVCGRRCSTVRTQKVRSGECTFSEKAAKPI
jgi:hypothetical protein